MRVIRDRQAGNARVVALPVALPNFYRPGNGLVLGDDPRHPLPAEPDHPAEQAVAGAGLVVKGQVRNRFGKWQGLRSAPDADDRSYVGRAAEVGKAKTFLDRSQQAVMIRATNCPRSSADERSKR
jgi:hypothetical protein